MRFLRSLLSEQNVRDRDFFLGRNNRAFALEIEIVNGLLAIPSWAWTNARHAFRASNAVTVLDAWAALLPARIVNEDLADYVEDANRRIADGQHKLVWVRVLAALLWTGLNTAVYLFAKLRKLRKRRG